MKPSTIDTQKDRKTEKGRFGIEFGKYLRKIREKRGISQENLSLNAGYYRTYVNKIEQGYYSPSLHTVWRLAHVLGLTLSDFLKGF
ncbi:helix-turn-helix transcriptional regulator [Patescibacteria group bacterium]|nr:helix-turn-helix transcriptional regulator [Patescibacteria group bacterium]MCG2701767.1 helix-turn-helix transcriptional regulator [Candidatus Parcubacteria bacterium]MBU4264672.1 helix-turn-helix transcriptional regulator [Patescibacteria group bacterium]MBU4390627.1 helix-turn-helix transcriptional regulator [Patescibacteria group bacterium]MBU4431023.1 helix-turn-helix transcriptional regulator [Patescibacteria group bacterium]